MATEVIAKNIISPKEFQKLQNELDHLVKIIREELKVEIQEAASLGDIPENFPYVEAIARQRVNEKRIQEIEGFLHECVVSDAVAKSDRVKIGSTVEVQKSDGRILKFKIVTSEALVIDRKPGLISADSDIGKALINKKIKDRITVKTPAGVSDLIVISIS